MRLACALLSVAAPLVALWYATPADRAAHGLAVQPFGVPSLLVVHAMCAVPSAWLLGRLLAARVKPESAGGVVLLALLAAGAGCLAADELGAQLESAGFAARAFARTVLCFILALLWCIAANAGAVLNRIDPLAALAAAVVGVGLPAVHADRLADQAVAEAEVLFHRERMALAVPHLAAAADLDPDRAFSDRETVRRKQTKLAALLVELTKQANQPTAKPTVSRATVLIALDRLPEAEDVLRSLADRNPLARLYLGECRHLQGRWDNGDADIRGALVELLPRAANRETANDCRKGFDRLAESATKRNRPAEREAVLREALEKLPGQAGYWHLQLGRHFQLSGRPFAALEECDLAEKADGKLKPELDALRRHLREHTPGCVVK